MVDTDDTRQTTEDGRQMTDDGQRQGYGISTGELKIVHYLSIYAKYDVTFWVLNWQSNLLKTFFMKVLVTKTKNFCILAMFKVPPKCL